jgi:4'-phosphopantetheinyl transferase
MYIYWLEQSARDVPCDDRWLSRNERARLGELHIHKRRADWRLGRWTAKRALSRYFSLTGDPDSLAAVEVLPEPTGAPSAFLYGEAARVEISLSHSFGTGLCAIAPPGAGLGCDLERVESRTAAFLADYFTADEQQLVEQTPAARQDELLTLLWSAKESVLKALGCGLRADTRSTKAIVVGPLQPDVAAWRPLSASHECGRVFNGWWRESRDFVYTILVDPVPASLIGLQLRPFG